MNLSFHNLKAALATTISLWMAVLACFMGCVVPAVANPNSAHSSMADMPCHSHHSGPVNPSDRKQVPGSPMSCCPLEVTVTAKPQVATVVIAPTDDSLLTPKFELLTISFYPSVDSVSVFHSGRDTLLKTNLLRI